MRNIFDTVKRSVIKYFEDSCLVRASGLAYSTLLAIVPFITVIYAFGGFDNLGRTIQSQILSAIIPTQQDAIMEALDSFTRNSLATGTLGMFTFLLTSIFLINTIARNFDAIWGVSSNVNFFRRYATYTAILVFGSLLLGISTSLTSAIENYFVTSGIKDISGFNELVSYFLPFLITLGIFFLMLIIIPSAKVKFRSAAIGAVISAVLFEVIKKVFALIVVNSVRNSFIYGSLAVIPIFLLGLYLFWLIVLIGVEASYFAQFTINTTNGFPMDLNMEERLCLGIDIYYQIAKSYSENRIGGITPKEIERCMGVSQTIIDPFLTNFIEKGLLLGINNKKGGVIPSRSLDRILMSDIIESIYGANCRISGSHKIAKITSMDFTKGGYNALPPETLLEIINMENLNEQIKNSKTELENKENKEIKG